MRFTSSVVLAIAIIGFGYFVGSGMKNFNRSERVISVRGLSEREVMSNLGVLKINFNVSSDRIDEVRKLLPESQKHIVDFLTQCGFDAAEITRSSSIKDRQAQDYGGDKGNRFVASGQFSVTTQKVEIVEKCDQKIDELLKLGIVITSNQAEFFFTDLNQIKPTMLDEATKNAREAAQGFAKSMGVGVGEMKSASQGVFSVDNTVDGGTSYEMGMPRSSLKKNVRVVTQVEFYID